MLRMNRDKTNIERSNRVNEVMSEVNIIYII